ncbi:ABC transporter permease [Conexibacter arvalis]|uniref:NitT/TauT family transport system permease protein n=1 Tax=Conexibacter arvalis TaxID=912552 RepID=A0A840IAA6_9ACTN|nr:ABC transporter permease [Conexibacter arvalis]MBB4661839.1 NitT/TauT family transport system permease protein [Conexibacter arvalis]
MSLAPGTKGRERLITAAVVVGVLALWYVAALLVQSGDDPLAASKLPYPHGVIEQIVDNRSVLAEAGWTTLKQALIGFAVGAVVGIFSSVVMAQAAWLEAGVIPFILAAQMIPMIALVPIAQNIFKNDDVTRIFIAAFITFFSVSIAVLRGLKSAPPPAYELMSSYNAGRAKTLRYLRLPAAVPMMFTGLRIAAPLSLVGSVLVDLSGAQSGLGYLMLAAITFGSEGAAVLWGAMIVLLALGFLMTQAVVLVERIVAPWQPDLRHGKA